MYTKKEFKTQLEMLYYYYKEPVKELIDRSGFTHPTVRKFLKGNALRTYNQDVLIEVVIKMNEEAVEKRRSLQQRGKRVIQLELELTEREHMKNNKCIL